MTQGVYVRGVCVLGGICSGGKCPGGTCQFILSCHRLGETFFTLYYWHTLGSIAFQISCFIDFLWYLS